MKVVLQISPIRCAGCIKSIENHLLQLEGVKSAIVFPQVGKVRVVFDQSKVAEEHIEKSILALNFPVLSIKSSRRKRE